MRLPAWWDFMFVWKFVQFFGPFAISIVALGYVLYDRHPRLKIKARKGDWYTLKDCSRPRYSVMFGGVVEIYNVSSRANAIREYRFLCKRAKGDWEEMESEYYFAVPLIGAASESLNRTPLILAPYAGVDAKIQAFIKKPRPVEMRVRIEVEDLFGKRYRLDVTAKS
jgi:hypothetical protein